MRLVIIYPGLNATPDGESRHFTLAHPFRYRLLAERLQAEGVAAVLRLASCPAGIMDGQVAVDRLAGPLITPWLMPGPCAAIAVPNSACWGFPRGQGRLPPWLPPTNRRPAAVAPSGHVGPRRIVAGLNEYAASSSSWLGNRTRSSGRDAACLFDQISPGLRAQEVRFVPGCDHFFTKAHHDQLLEETSMEVFAGSDKHISDGTRQLVEQLEATEPE